MALIATRVVAPITILGMALVVALVVALLVCTLATSLATILSTALAIGVLEAWLYPQPQL